MGCLSFGIEHAQTECKLTYHNCVSPLLGLIITRFFKRAAEGERDKKKKSSFSCFSNLYPFSLLPGQYHKQINKNENVEKKKRQKACQIIIMCFLKKGSERGRERKNTPGEKRVEKELVLKKREKAEKEYEASPLKLLTASFRYSARSLAACVRSKS